MVGRDSERCVGSCISEYEKRVRRRFRAFLPTRQVMDRTPAYVFRLTAEKPFGTNRSSWRCAKEMGANSKLPSPRTLRMATASEYSQAKDFTHFRRVAFGLSGRS